MVWQCISLASALFTSSMSLGMPPQRNPVFTGTVIEVLEGDLFKVRTKDWGDYKVKLWGTDAPELDQPFGEASKKYLKDMILKRSVIVSVYSAVGGGRGIQIGWVSTNESSEKQTVNERMVSTGHAWWERLRYNRELQTEAGALLKCEEAARVSKIGLWSKPNPLAPWDWKKLGKPTS